MKSSFLKNHQARNQTRKQGEINSNKPFRKIRIIVSDPYATDSTDDEFDHRRPSNNSSPKLKRVVQEISIPIEDPSDKLSKKDSGKITRPNINKVKRVRRRNSCVERAREDSGEISRPNRFRGVRRRKSSSWTAEIRDPFKKRKIFLGTFGTGEEASRVFEAKKAEFRERLDVQSAMERARLGCGSGTDSSNHSGEIIEAEMNMGSVLIDNNGFLLGEFSNLDDDLTISD